MVSTETQALLTCSWEEMLTFGIKVPEKKDAICLASKFVDSLNLC